MLEIGVKRYWLALLLWALTSQAEAGSCNHQQVAASGLGGLAGAAMGTALLGPAGEVLGGALGGAVGNAIAYHGKSPPAGVVGSAAGGAGGAILGRGVGGGTLLAVIGAGFGSAGGACLAQKKGSPHASARQKTVRVNASSQAQALLGGTP